MLTGIEIVETNTLGAISMRKFAKLSNGLTLVLSATDKLDSDLLLKTYTIVDDTFGNNLFTPAKAFEFEFIDSRGTSYFPENNHTLIQLASLLKISTTKIRYTLSKLIELQEFQVFKRVGKIIGTLEKFDFVKGIVGSFYIEGLFIGGDATLLTSFDIKRKLDFSGYGHPVHFSGIHFSSLHFST